MIIHRWGCISSPFVARIGNIGLEKLKIMK
jgi:hypothetical protein